MFGKHATWTVIVSLGWMTFGCQDSRYSGLALQNEKMEATMNEPRAHYANMVDNAILHDMSIADFHFVPHTSELSGTGVARLDRMGPLLDTYGGTVRYETQTTDEVLVQARLDHVREYLTVVGCDMDRIELRAMMSGGRGMTAIHALRAEGAAYPRIDDGVKRSEQIITSKKE